MRLADLSDYLAARRLFHDPWDVVRFRKRQRRGDELAVRLRSGHRFRVRGGGGEYHLFHRLFLRDEYRVDRFSPGAWECVVDLGANVGFFSIRAALLARRVVAVEPAQGVLARLIANVAGLPIEIVCAAGAATDGSAPLYHPSREARTGSASLLPVRDHPMSGRFEEVETLTLATLLERCGIERCDLLKLDVEGSEYDVLYNAPRPVLERVRRLHCEFHAGPARRATGPALAEHLERQGFRVTLAAHRRRPGRGLLFASRGA